MNRPPPRLHAVTDDSILNLSDYTLRARALARPDVALHIRSRSFGGRRLTELATLTSRACSARASIFINDRADLASVTVADGLHLPAAGLPIAAAREILGPDVWIGRSAHSVREALDAAAEGADYVFLGPIWQTTSHPELRPIGPEAIAAARQVPIVAIGGVTIERVRIALEAGAYGVAAISALWRVPNPGSAAERMLLSFTQ